MPLHYHAGRNTPPQTLMIDLCDCCLTQNYWHEVIKPFITQSLPDFLSDRWHSPDFRRHFTPLAESLLASHDTPIHTPDVLFYSQILVNCIQKDQWPKGLASLVSQIISLGVGTHYLEAQLHADSISSLKRWHGWGWRIITISELSSNAQRHILQNTQVGDLSGYVSHSLPLSVNLPNIEHCTLVSPRACVLKRGKALGYQTLQLNRCTDNNMQTAPFTSPPAFTQVIELDLVDFFITPK